MLSLHDVTQVVTASNFIIPKEFVSFSRKKDDNMFLDIMMLLTDKTKCYPPLTCYILTSPYVISHVISR
jgi:hypothetical protein